MLQTYGFTFYSNCLFQKMCGKQKTMYKNKYIESTLKSDVVVNDLISSLLMPSVTFPSFHGVNFNCDSFFIMASV